jgi:hypothetical protein
MQEGAGPIDDSRWLESGIAIVSWHLGAAGLFSSPPIAPTLVRRCCRCSCGLAAAAPAADLPLRLPQPRLQLTVHGIHRGAQRGGLGQRLVPLLRAAFGGLREWWRGEMWQVGESLGRWCVGVLLGCWHVAGETRFPPFRTRTMAFRDSRMLVSSAAAWERTGLHRSALNGGAKAPAKAARARRAPRRRRRRIRSVGAPAVTANRPRHWFR